MTDMLEKIRKIFKPLAIGALLLTSVPAFADVKAGVDAWERGDYNKAVAEWRGPAIEGDPDAQFNMGQAYKLGRGVPMDLNLAQDWFRRAADQGHLQAGDNYGLILFQNNRRQDAMPYIRASAARGEPRAQYVLGTALFNGDMGEKDWVRAYALMTRASAQGVPQAGKSLATMDQYIPMADRQQGTQLAAQLERDANAERLRMATAASSAQGPVASAMQTSSKIQTTTLPPSAASSSWANGQAASAGVDYAGPSSTTPAPAVAVPATTAPVTPVAAKGAWRVQLGAFGDDANARNLWTSLESRYSQLTGLQPFLVKSGRLTKLQAGPFASSADAKRLCDTLGAAGQACFATKP